MDSAAKLRANRESRRGNVVVKVHFRRNVAMMLRTTARRREDRARRTRSCFMNSEREGCKDGKVSGCMVRVCSRRRYPQKRAMSEFGGEGEEGKSHCAWREESMNVKRGRRARAERAWEWEAVVVSW